MKLINTCIALFTLCGSLNAQVKAKPGQAFKVTTATDLNIKMTLMGQDMEVKNVSTQESDYQVKLVTGDKYVMTNTIRRVSGKISAMGQEQQFNSDDSATRKDPQLADMIRLLDQPSEIVVEKGVVSSKSDLGDLMGSIAGTVNNDHAKYLLDIDPAKLKLGSKWMDSTGNEASKNVNEYTVVKADAQTVELLILTQSIVKGTTIQNGMELKTDLKGATTAKRSYNLLTGLLQTEECDVAISGTIDMMGMNAPVNSQGKIKTTVR